MCATAITSFQSIVTVTPNTAVDRVIQVPGFAIGAHRKGARLARMPAGKGVNVSRVLALLGQRSIATGFVGDAELAEFDRLAERSLITSQFLAVEGSTRENITLLDPEQNVETHVRTTGFVVQERDVERLRRKLGLLAKPGVLISFGGSLPEGLEPGVAVAMLEAARSAGAALALDLDGAVLRRLRETPAWLVKCNREEFLAAHAGLADEEDAIVARGRKWSQSIGVVVVTNGGAGGYLFSGGSAWRGRSALDPRAVVSTVGCGDALLAGFIAAVQQGKSVLDAYAFSLATATAAATSAVPGEFDPQVVDDLLKRTTVTQLDATD